MNPALHSEVLERRGLCCTTIAQQWPHLKPHLSRDLWQRERPYDGEVEALEERALFHVGLQMNGLRR
jgi:hypothetical protein